VASARNLGAHEARGQDLIFLDHDDVVTPGYLAAMGAALADSEVAAARLDLDALNPGWVASSRPPVQQVGLSDGLFPFGAGASLGAQRRAFEALGGFATTVGSAEDRDLCFRAALAGMKVTFVPEAVLRYRYRASPSAIFRQARRGGRSSAFLYAAYGKHGMRPRLVRNEIAKAIRALAGLVRTRDIGTRAHHAHRLGAVVGYVEGSVRRRVAYLRWRLPHAA